MMNLSGFADEAGQQIEAQVAATVRLGWKYLDLRSIEGVNIGQLDDARYALVVDSVQTAGLQVSSFGSAIANWARNIKSDFQTDIDDLRRSAPRMRALGTRYIRIMSYPNDGLDDGDYRTEVYRRLRELVRIAEGEGVVLAHENCSGYGGLSGQNSVELLEELDSPAFLLIYDTGNPIQHGQEPFPFYQAMREHIAYVHIKDAKVQPDGSHVFSFCGEGDGLVPRVLADLAAQGFDGFVSIEPHLSAVIHAGKAAGANASDLYVEYGQRLERLVAAAQAAPALIA